MNPRLQYEEYEDEESENRVEEIIMKNSSSRPVFAFDQNVKDLNGAHVNLEPEMIEKENVEEDFSYDEHRHVFIF